MYLITFLKFTSGLCSLSIRIAMEEGLAKWRSFSPVQRTTGQASALPESEGIAG